MGILSFALIALGLFYLVFALIAIIRLIKVISTKNAIFISIAFYLVLSFASIARAASMYLIATNLIPSQDEEANIFIYLMLIIPDMILMCVYLFLIWYFFGDYIISHINVANDLNLFVKNDDPVMKKKTYIVLYVVLAIYISCFCILCVLSYIAIIGDTVLYTINSCINIATPFFFIGYYIFLLVKFSGRPYIEERFKEQSKRVLIIVLIWSAARIVIGILGIVLNSPYLQAILHNYSQNENNVGYSIVIIVYFIATEYIPNFFVLDNALTKTYNNNQSSEDERKLIAEEEHVIDVKQNEPSIWSTPENVGNSSIVEKEKVLSVHQRNTIKGNLRQLLVKFNDINMLQMMFSRKNGLGTIKKALFHGMEVTCREVSFDRLSRYDLEGISKDIEEIVSLNHHNICRIHGICVENNPNIHILTPFFKLGSLHDVLHQQKSNLGLEKRIEIAKGIARGMNYLHENMLYHFHLSSKNVYLDDDFTPYIADYGFHYLKDISSVFLKYKNKNSYSSPEILKDPKSIGSQQGSSFINEKCDVYSFGLLLWELYTCTVPFNVKLSTVFDYVVTKNCRPEITSNFNKEIGGVIRKCWDSDPLRRPSFREVLDLLTMN